MSWKPGDRVVHQRFGPGTVLACDDQHTVIHFDDQGRRTFSTPQVVLSEAGKAPTSAPAMRESEQIPAHVGFENARRQTVVRQTNLAANVAGQRVFVMKCGNCGHQYGARECDIHIRRCPQCDGGQPGVPY